MQGRITAASFGPPESRNQTSLQPFLHSSPHMSSGILGHVLSAKNCCFAWTDLHPHLIHSSFSPSEPTAVQHTAMSAQLYHNVLFGTIASRYTAPYRPMILTQLYHNFLLVAWISSTRWSRTLISNTINDYFTQFSDKTGNVLSPKSCPFARGSELSCNTCFLESKSEMASVFAQLTAECRRTLPLSPFATTGF